MVRYSSPNAADGGETERRKEGAIARLPRIRITMKRDDSDRKGSASLTACGLALHLAWILSSSFGSLGIIPGGSVPAFFELTGLRVPLPFVVALIAQALTLLCAGVLAQHRPGFLSSKQAVAGAALAVAAGSAVVLGIQPDGQQGLAASVVAAVAIGVGAAELLLFWGVAFSKMDVSSIALNVGLALTGASALYACLAFLVPAGAGHWLVALLPLLELPFARLSTPARYARERSLPLFAELPVKRGKFGSMMGAALFLSGLSLGMLKALSAEEILSCQDAAVPVFALLLAGILVTLLLSLILQGDADDDPRWDLLLRPLMAVMVAAAFASPLLFGTAPTAALLLLFASYLYVEAVMWVYLTGLSQEYRLSAVFLVGIGRGAFTLGALGGIWLVLESPLVASLPDGYAGAAVLAALAVGYVLNPRIAIVKRTALKARGSVRANADVLERTLPSGSAGVGRAGALGMAGAVGGSGAVGGGASGGAADGFGASGAEAVGGFGNGGSTAGVANGVGAADGSRRAGGASGPAVGTGEGGASTGAGVGITTPAASPRLDPQAEANAFKRVCEEIGGRYLLSQRQTEVLYLLARGHNAAHVQEKLGITRNTAKSHMNKIYRKLDIHTQQELLMMVEDELATLENTADGAPER